MISGSMVRLADTLVSQARRLARSARTEEDLRIGFEKILEPVLRSVGIETKPRYERLAAAAKTVYRGRPDAVHGQVIIEYEPPNAFSTPRSVPGARRQLVDYMTAEAASGDLHRMVGVGFDGHSIFFVRYQGKPGPPVAEEAFVVQGPYAFGPEAARTLLTYLRALARMPLSAENVATRFGPTSDIAPMAVSGFVDALGNWSSERVQVFFQEWRRLFGIVYGEQFGTRQQKEAAELARLYRVPTEIGFQELLFCVHTYFALLMKFMAAELLTLRETAFHSSFSGGLAHAAAPELKSQLTEIEEGGLYAKQGITNFLEGDFFRWYLDALSPRLEEAIREMARALSEFEPATTVIEPGSTRDLLKKLYQYLVPRAVRHRLGEYYTPDWLAELVLDEIGYDGNTLQRVLDPACGSGTFLVLAIARAKEYGRAHGEPPLETAKRVAGNIWGFDLNPLAVIAARTNYLLALGDVVDQLSSLEIPVHLADSVLWPETSGQGSLNFAGGDHARVRTSVREFHVPAIWIRNKGFLMSKAAPLVERLARQGYGVDEAVDLLKKEGLVFPPHEKVVANFYKEIWELERQARNGIWARLLKNVFAPLVAGKFDFVVGNPPWIRWGYLSQEYREATLKMWKGYGLFSLKGHAARLGGGEKDFSMLFTYAAADYYLKKGGRLGFLITQEVFKSKGAGEGFRRFQLGDRDPLRVLKAHDLVSVRPFEGAANKTAAVILKKGEKTRYPVAYWLWRRKSGVGKVPTDLTLRQARALLEKRRLLARPIGSNTGSWQTIAQDQTDLLHVGGTNAYRARRGASTEPYGVFWLEVRQVLSDGDLIVRNLPQEGKLDIQQVEDRIEADLVFPGVRGADIKRWRAEPKLYVLLAQDPRKSQPYPETQMKKTWPRTYGYLTRFKEALLCRGSAPVRELAERTAFYAMFGIGPYTVARYKVVWKRMASDLVAAVIAQCKTPFGYKKVIPTDTTSLFATESEAEAHYLCGVINSRPVREFVRSYSSAGRGFGAPSAMDHIGIPEFEPKNALHMRIAEASMRLHECQRKGQAEQIPALESENDRLVSRLFGLKAPGK